MPRLREKGHKETWTIQGFGPSTVFRVKASDADNPRSKAAATSAEPRTVFIMIPGNPGVLDYYTPFAESIFNNAKTNIDVINLQHPGHSTLDFSSGVIEAWGKKRGTRDPLSLECQIQHKVAMFDHIKALYPKGTRFVLGGHSIGAFMALRVLRERPDGFSKLVLLFPTLKHISDTKNGKVVSWLVSPGIRHLTALFLWFWKPVLMAFPVVFYSMIALVTGLTGNALKVTCDQLLHHTSGYHATVLGHWEMKEVREMDLETIETHHDKLVLFYGPEDGWADESHFLDVKRRFPDIQAHLCNDKIPHDFVIAHSEVVARKVVSWLSL
ncbi:hypothetical protein BDR26DRAFT_862916 [Obelidium mucronatum]|nr:hypothetical protein BDR26DRAFT_862916 [Obelidium mucronatum]